LSLAIMTGAFAKELGLGVRYQTVNVASTWGRSGNLVLHNSHVNVSLKKLSATMLIYGDEWITIDFIPVPEFYRVRTQVIDETRMVAMYMNNRAAEALAIDRVDAAYWWARAAVLQDRAYADAYNTLGVVYRRRGESQWAEAAMRRTLALDPDNTNAIGNLASLMQRQGRLAEAVEFSARLERLQPELPFQNFERGMLALRAGDYRLARDLLEKEVKPTNDYHEVHLGLAIAYLNLGDTATAARHLTLARENSSTRRQQALYAAKLEQLKAMVH
ncbi:MAG TPA: tetratricopeptide repeat protein, partial [Ideonella sp.]|nr:tetratricopeptide repeat protein [Ideonella sp.]